MIYIIHGLFHTGDRWQHLAQELGNATSIYCPDLGSINELARALAPRMVGAEMIIGHSAGGLVLYEMITRGYITPPPKCVFVATPFFGITKLKKMRIILPLARIPRTEFTVAMLAKFTVNNPKFVDKIMVKDGCMTNTPNSYKLLKEVVDYHVTPFAIKGSEVYLCEGRYDQLVDRCVFPGATSVMFDNSGHTLMLEDEATFIRFINTIRGR